MDFMQNLVGSTVKAVTPDPEDSGRAVITLVAPCGHDVVVTSTRHGTTMVSADIAHVRECDGRKELSLFPGVVSSIYGAFVQPLPDGDF